MQELVATPVGLTSALPNSENHGEQEDSAAAAIDLVVTRVAPPKLPNSQNHGEQQSPVVVTVSKPVALSITSTDEMDDDSVVDNTDGNQDPVDKGDEHGTQAGV